MKFDVFPHTILLVRSGSRCYGTHTKDSDLDLQGVAIAPPKYYLGLESFEQANDTGMFDDTRFYSLLSEEDREIAARTKCEGTIYDVRKFIRLASASNPNMLDALFCRDSDVILASRAGTTLRENRRLFLSRQAEMRYGAYALGQMQRVALHRDYLLNPIHTEPTRAEYGLPASAVIPAEQLGAINAAITKQLDHWELRASDLDQATILQVQEHIQETLVQMGIASENKWILAAKTIGLDDDIIHILEKERAFARAIQKWRSYKKWQKDRNPARAALEAKFGYDLKCALHATRLVLTCEELLRTGELHVYRGDRDIDTLIDVLNGKWTYEQLMSWMEEKRALLKQLALCSPLPTKPDMDKIDELCCELISSTF
jgi:predicted nucleotidyltransferase